MPTNTQKIDELVRTVVKLEAILEERSRRQDAEADRLRDETRRLQQAVEGHATKITATEQRCAALEKGTDRFWQIAPMIISGIAVLVSLIVAFLKK